MSAAWKHFNKCPRIVQERLFANTVLLKYLEGVHLQRISALHLKSKHPDQHVEHEREMAAAKRQALPSPSTPTSSVVDVIEKGKKFAGDSAKTKGIAKKILDFIPLDDQPFTVVEDVRFRRLLEHIEPLMSSRWYFSDTLQLKSKSSWLQILQLTLQQRHGAGMSAPPLC